MPIYTYCCEKCDHEFDGFMAVADYQKDFPCPICFCAGKRTVGWSRKGPSWSDNQYPYFDPGLDRVVESPKDRQDAMNNLNCYSREGGKQMTRRQEQMMKDLRLNGNSKGSRYAQVNASRKK